MHRCIPTCSCTSLGRTDEETFLGEASRSEEACQKMWDEWGEAAKDLKKQLYRKIKESWLS